MHPPMHGRSNSAIGGGADPAAHLSSSIEYGVGGDTQLLVDRSSQSNPSFYRRFLLASGVVGILFLLIGPNGLSFHDDDPDGGGRLNYHQDKGYVVPARSKGKDKRNKKKRNKDGAAGIAYSIVDDDRVPAAGGGGTFEDALNDFAKYKQKQYKKKKKDKKKKKHYHGEEEEPHPQDGRQREEGFALPVYDYTDSSADVIPEGVGEDLAARPAYDALECRSSVIDFVINATDVKDECEGLRKAFDKTCSAAPANPAAVQGQGMQQSQEYQGQGPNYAYDGERHDELYGDWGRRQRRQRRRRLLGTAAESYRDESWGGYATRTLRTWYRTHVRRYLRPSGAEGMLFVEDEIVGEAWDDAAYQVDHGYDDSVEYADRARRLLSSRPAAAAAEKEEREKEEWADWARTAGVRLLNRTELAASLARRGLSESFRRARRAPWSRAGSSREEGRRRAGRRASVSPAAALDGAAGRARTEAAETAAAAGVAVGAAAQKQEGAGHAVGGIRMSPSLPTASEHVGGQMLNDAILLTDGGTNEKIAAAINATGQAGAGANATAPGVSAAVAAAAADAAKSSEAVSKATVAVSAVLNDPSSVEARTCCASILNVFHEHCDHPDGDEFTDRRLFIIVFVIAFCGMVKSLIRHFRIRWLPEAAGCILVGVAGGQILQFFPHYDFGFDGDMFLRVMVPPIVFEAALSIDKTSFQRHVIPIMIYAVAGTLLSTLVTALVVSKGSAFLSFVGIACPSIPFVESLTFGALISSIDPIAVLSVLSNMGMTDTDTIYVLIFGESLLNDGVAIVLFETLVHFLDESLIIDRAAVWAATAHFIVVAVGSVLIGLVSGACCACYYYIMHGIQTPLVEVLMFLCWAFIPYYICDGVEWSGIVAVVAAGFVMDLYVVGQHCTGAEGSWHREREVETPAASGTNGSMNGGPASRRGTSMFGRIFTRDGHLSEKSRNHIHFVTEINSTLMETAIFAYLGLFLFDSRYHWNFWLSIIAVLACVFSRAIMIPVFSLVANWLNGITSMATIRSLSKLSRSGHSSNGHSPPPSDNRRGVFIDVRMQIVLWFAGLRGAMSFALVENIPLFDTVTGQGSRMKPELKAMTSASIMFTVFVLGGSTYYLLERLGMSPLDKEDDEMLEMGAPLVRKRGGKGGHRKGSSDVSLADLGIDSSEHDTTTESVMRHRGGAGGKQGSKSKFRGGC